MPLQLEIVTPEASIYADEVDTVVLPGCEGEMGVLPQHAPLVTLLSAGELRIVKLRGTSRCLPRCAKQLRHAGRARAT